MKCTVDYAKCSGLWDFVISCGLTALDYVDQSQLNNVIPSIMLTPRLDDCLQDLEDEVTGGGGTFAQMEATLKDMQNQKLGAAILVSGYTFMDQRSTSIWLQTLGDVDLVQFFPIARLQLSGLMEGFDSEGGEPTSMADAKMQTLDHSILQRWSYLSSSSRYIRIISSSTPRQRRTPGEVVMLSMRLSLQRNCTKEIWSIPQGMRCWQNWSGT